LEPATIFRNLRRRRRWIAVGVAAAGLAALTSVVSLSLFPPSIHKKPLAFSTARVQMLVDTSASSFLDTQADIWVLNERTPIIGLMLSSPAALDYIGHAAGIPGNKIAAEAPLANNLQRSQVEPTADKRAIQIVGERDLYRLEFDQSSTLPIIGVRAQAPTARAAATLANAVPRGFDAYLHDLSHTPPSSHEVGVRALTTAVGSPVSSRADLEVGMFVFVVVFVFWCGLVLIASSLLDALRIARGGQTAAGNSPVSPAGPFLTGS
jgi:hypothetical protein